MNKINFWRSRSSWTLELWVGIVLCLLFNVVMSVPSQRSTRRMPRSEGALVPRGLALALPIISVFGQAMLKLGNLLFPMPAFAFFHFLLTSERWSGAEHCSIVICLPTQIRADTFVYRFKSVLADRGNWSAPECQLQVVQV